MRGRKPKAGAIRRGGAEDVAASVLAAPQAGPEKPAEVAASPSQSALWDLMVGTGRGFAPEDAPVLADMVFWMDVSRDLRARMEAPDGSLRTMVPAGEGPDGEAMCRPNPMLRELQRSTTMVLKLSDQLGCTPLARARIGLTRASGASVGLTIAEQVAAAMERRAAG